MDKSQQTIDDTLMVSLRKCGHYLHHNVTKDNMQSHAEIFQVLTLEEKENLTVLLQKCLNSWTK